MESEAPPQKKKITNKMKNLRNHSQLHQQENSPKAVNNETDLFSLTDLEFEREIVKILKELREDMNSNAGSEPRLPPIPRLTATPDS